MSTAAQDEMFPDDAPATAADKEGFELAVRDPRDSGTLEVFPPARSPMSEARAMLADHRAMLDDAYYTANVVCQTPAAPQRYRGKAKEGTVAIMYGAELGLPPMASLQKVINIHGTPSLEARTMKGLLISKGYQFRTVKKTETEYEIHAWEPGADKRNDPPDEVANWTIGRAIKARYVPTPSSPDSQQRPDVDTDWVTVSKTWDGKTKTSVVGNMKYITDPTAMLEAKGTADVCRTIAPNIFLGLPYAAEERADWDDADQYGDDEVAEKPRRRGRAKGVNSLRDRAHAAAKEAAEVLPDNEPQDADVVEVVLEGSGGGGHSTAAPKHDGPSDEAFAAGTDTQTDQATTKPTKDLGGAVVAEEGTTGEELPGIGAPTATPTEASDGGLTPGKTGERAGGTGMPAPPSEPDSGAAALASAEPAAAPDPEQSAPAVSPDPQPSGPTPPAAKAGGTRQVTDEEAAAADPLPMSPDVRQKGERMLDGLLAEAKVDADEKYAVVAEIAAKGDNATYAAIQAWERLTNTELKYVVDVLRAHKQKGDLYDYCCEAANAAALREAGMLEG